MGFEPRAARQLAPGSHLIIDGLPGLRLQASQRSRVWVYRYKSPTDGRMRQMKLGEWPKMSFAAAIVRWEQLRTLRDEGRDPAAERRAGRRQIQEREIQPRACRSAAVLTIRALCDLYLSGHVERHRKPKGAAEVRRMFNTMLIEVADLPAAALTRAQAFDLLFAFSHVRVQAAKLRAELGAAWDFALDSGRLTESTPNWWRQIMRGRLRSHGKTIEGRSLGPSKRCLTESELAELIKWLPNFSRTVEEVLTLYLWTGMRGSEIVAMDVTEITEEADGLWWTVPKEKTKNARRTGAIDVRVPLIGRAAAIVRRRTSSVHDGFLFPSTGASGHIEQKAVQTAVHYSQPYSRTRPNDARPRLPVTHWAPHDLRRTVRTLLAALHCPDSVAEAVLGPLTDAHFESARCPQRCCRQRDGCSKSRCSFDAAEGPSGPRTTWASGQPHWLFRKHLFTPGLQCRQQHDDHCNRGHRQDGGAERPLQEDHRVTLRHQ